MSVIDKIDSILNEAKISVPEEAIKFIASSGGLRATAVEDWAKENSVDVIKVARAISSKKIDPSDVMTAIVGNDKGREKYLKIIKDATGKIK